MQSERRRVTCSIDRIVRQPRERTTTAALMQLTSARRAKGTQTKHTSVLGKDNTGNRIAQNTCEALARERRQEGKKEGRKEGRRGEAANSCRKASAHGGKWMASIVGACDPFRRTVRKKSSKSKMSGGKADEEKEAEVPT